MVDSTTGGTITKVIFYCKFCGLQRYTTDEYQPITLTTTGICPLDCEGRQQFKEVIGL